MPRSTVVYPSAMARTAKGPASLAQATRVPMTAPARKPHMATARVMPAAVRRAKPQPLGPNPTRSK